MEYARTAAQTAKINGFIYNRQKGKNAAVIDLSLIDTADNIPMEVKSALKDKILEALQAPYIHYEYESVVSFSGRSCYYVDAELSRTVVFDDDKRKYIVFSVCGLRYAKYKLNSFGIVSDSELPIDSGTAGRWYTGVIPLFEHCFIANR